ncbi:putative capsid protein [Lasius neglectus virus 1]|uniref:Putative capsid protein n=1 Tax=Lasius neglectus virus 1 TaxID=2018501 RepID=A0A220QTF1_9VIRU|nr:putative capsid protein [Lasius neglectus virus 1]ASK12195.1 putative capsid protein [Lasius neglectus virus 1]
MDQPTEIEKIETRARAKEFDHGTIPMQMANVILGLPTKPGPSFDDRSSVSSTGWTFDQLVSQRVLLTTINIDPSTGTTSTTPQFLLQNSWENIRKIHFRTLDPLFFLKSWKWHLTFQFRSNFQQVGLMAISYVNAPIDAYPYLTGKPQQYLETQLASDTTGNYGKTLQLLEHPLDSMEAIYQLPHTLVMMGEDQDVECTFNWLSPFKSAFNNVNPTPNEISTKDSYPEKYGTTYDMGNVRLHTLIPMTLASGIQANQLTVRIWSHLTDVEYAGYVPTDELI